MTSNVEIIQIYKNTWDHELVFTRSNFIGITVRKINSEITCLRSL